MPGAVEFLSALARETGGKVADHRVAAALHVQDRTVRAWRYGERRVPAHLLADLRRMRRDRANILAALAAAELRECDAEEARQ